MTFTLTTPADVDALALLLIHEGEQDDQQDQEQP